KALIASLETDVPMVAMEAAASLGRLGMSEAVEPLCEALKNADANVRASACTALGWLGGEKALSYLKDAEQDKDPFVQAAAKEARRSQATRSGKT
ncbi:MAG: HEAT repeat domain-containing protein, partial [Chloroflexota bacterium]|nr:HEAT repeat domain-containing protein [Chloroflexota bacterium]